MSTRNTQPEVVVERMESAFNAPNTLQERLREQLRFAATLAEHRDDEEWRDLIAAVIEDLETAQPDTDPEVLVERSESTLEPIADFAQSYTVHYVGHAHLDMNWLWDFPETAHSAYRTFSTMFDLMDEYPQFTFTQSQAATYAMMADEAPEVFEEIQERVRNEQWEVTANTWVQGDKNLVSGESQVRQFLYASEFIKRELAGEATPVDFEPDTFGHPQTMPKILQDAGIDYYYLGRVGADEQPDWRNGRYENVPQLFWWESPDGSRVLTFNGRELWYNGHVDPADVTSVVKFKADTGVGEFLELYGVGNHGGGPTRDDIETIRRMDDWPVFPEVTHSTVDEYFSAVEEAGTADLPVVDEQLNFTFRGCYSSQSRAKQYNRSMEVQLGTAEALSAIAAKESTFEYPSEKFRDAWRNVLFNQFHDILPGTGISETYDYAYGLYQEAEASARLACDRAIETLSWDGGIYHEDADSEGYAEGGIPLLVFNPTGRSRTASLQTLIYDYPETWDLSSLKVVDSDGNEQPVQTLETIDEVIEKRERGEYAMNWLPDPSRLIHDSDFGPPFVRIAFTVPNLPAFGYEILRLRPKTTEEPVGVTIKRGKDAVELENDRFRITVDVQCCGIESLYDKEYEYEFVPDNSLLGRLSVEHEAPGGMSAWKRHQITEEEPLNEGWKLKTIETGPVLGKVRLEREYNDSTIATEFRLPQDTGEVELSVDALWREFGTDDRGVPALRTHFPLASSDLTFRYDVPYGFEEHPADEMDIPANRWADITGSDGMGLTVTNDTTHGHSVDENTLSLTLLRSSYSPDLAPEIGRRTVECNFQPHGPDWGVGDAARFGREAAFEPIVEQLLPKSQRVAADRQRSFLHVDTDQVAVSSFKQAFDDDDLVVRLHELAGEPCTAEISVDWPIDQVRETNLLEDTRHSLNPSVSGGRISIDFEPNEVRTLRLTLA